MAEKRDAAGAGRMRQAICAAGLVGLLVLTLGACQTTQATYGAAAPQASVYGTNAPAQGFESVVPGSEEDFILNVGRRVYFKPGSAGLDETAKVTLDQQAAWLNQFQGWLVKVQGFADDPGNADKNRQVSQARADAVMGYLVSRGVAPNRMWSKGYGRDRLVRDCPEAKCKSQNRRAISNLREEFDAAAGPSNS